MLKAGIAGILALGVMGSSLAFADAEANRAQQNGAAVQSEVVVVSHAQLTRLKSTLKLTPEQEQHWPAVERAFRDLGKQQEDSAASQGLVQGISNRAVAIGLNALALRRLAAAAYPLIKALNNEQKQSALTFARSVGLESMAQAF